MPKSFVNSISPIARKTSLYSPLPGAFFKPNPSTSSLEIEDKLVWDDNSPLFHVRFDSSLSLWERCIEMYKAIMGTHYIEKLYPSHKKKQASSTQASLFSDFCEEDWIFYCIADARSQKNAELMLYMGKYHAVKSYENGAELQDDTIYIQITDDKKVFYTLKNLNGELFPTDIDESTLPQSGSSRTELRSNAIQPQARLNFNISFTKQILNKMKENGHFQNKKVIQLYNYNQKNNTIDFQLLSNNDEVFVHTISLDELNKMIDDEQSALPLHQLSYKTTLKVQLYFQNLNQQAAQSGIGQLASALGNREGVPQMLPILDAVYKKCILGYLVRKNAIQQVDHYVMDIEHAKGQKGLLDYLVFPLVARKISYDAIYYQNKKIESWIEYPIKFILYTPLVHILAITNILLEMLRMVSGMLLALICAATVIPVLHYQLKHSKNETQQSSSPDHNDDLSHTEEVKPNETKRSPSPNDDNVLKPTDDTVEPIYRRHAAP